MHCYQKETRIEIKMYKLVLCYWYLFVNVVDLFLGLTLFLFHRFGFDHFVCLLLLGLFGLVYLSLCLHLLSWRLDATPTHKRERRADFGQC